MNTNVMMKRHPKTAIALGYRNVLWYRGGLEAWNHAQIPFARRGGASAAGNGNGFGNTNGNDRG